jgi:peptidoglycan/xylan/chitin deacetylase (PgdA/CDA1 family)
VTSVVYRVTSRLSPGEIVLMHVGSHPTDHSTLDGDALRNVIDDLKAAGYGFVTIPQGLGLAH